MKDEDEVRLRDKMPALLLLGERPITACVEESTGLVALGWGSVFGGRVECLL